MKIKQLKNDLSDFLGKLKYVKINDFDEMTKQSIYLDYKELYKVYSRLSKREINNNFSEKEIRAIDCLSLGLENETKFNKLLSKFQKDNATSILNVVDFIKSREGFELINSNGDFSKFSDDELVEIFGSLFGIQVAKDSVSALKAEKVGRVIGYALSELFNDHLKEFKKMQKNNSKLDLGFFLKEKIQQHDFECAYTYREDGNNLQIRCTINEENNASITDTRGRNRVDHCFVNHKLKTITFGQSTSNKDVDDQGYSPFKTHLILKNLVSKQTVDGEPNIYYGYKLNSFLMLGGRFVVDDQKITQEQGRDFKKMLPNANKDDLKKLAQLQYFGFYGNTVNQEQANSLALFNVFIAGCDTLNLYEFSEKMAVLPTAKEKNQLAFKTVTKYLTDVCNILSDNKLSLASGGKTDLLLSVTDIVEISKGLLRNFDQKLTRETYVESIKPLHKAIDNLRDTFTPIAGMEGAKLANELRTINKVFATQKSYNEELQEQIKPVIQNITWVDNENKRLEFSSENLNFIIDIAKHIHSQMGTQGKKFYSRYIEELENHLIKGNDVDSASFAPAKTYFFREYGYGPQARFIEKSSFILDGRLTTETIDEKIQELGKYIRKDLMKTYPELHDILIEENVAKKAKP